MESRAQDNRSWATRCLDFVAGHPILDLVAISLVVGIHAVVVERWWDNGSMLASVAPNQRLLVYGALATVAALAAGTNNAAVGSYVGSASDAMSKLREHHGGRLRKSLRSIGGWLWACAVAAVICIMLDPADPKDPESTRGGSWVAEAVLIALAVKFARLTFLQDLVLAANDWTSQRPQLKPLRRRKKAAVGED